MSMTGTGAGSLSVFGAGTAYAYPVATGAGSLSISGSATAYAYAAAVGDGSLSISGSGAATAHPAATGGGSLSITGAGSGAGYAAGIGAGLLSITGAAAGGPVVTGSGAGLLSITGDGGDTPRGVGAGSLSLSGSGSAWVGSSASGVWLYLHTVPPAQVYQVDALRSRLHQGLPMHRVPFEVSATAAQIGRQNDSFRVSLDAPSLTLRSRIAAQGPYGVRVDVMDGGTLSRTGIVSSVSAGAAGGIELDCESSGWADDLPLRTSADVGVYLDVQPLPWRYGRAVPGRLVRINEAGTLWLWADHASSGISSVTADGQPYGAWSWRNDVDGNGHPITVVQTADAFDEGATLVAVGDGALDPTAGTLMTSPADVAYDLCLRAGLEIDRGALVAFRTECIGRGIEISGSIDSGSLQGALVAIADSIYAVFSRELPGLMRLRPRTGATVTIPSRDTPTATTERADIATRIRARYAYEDGKAKATIDVRAPAVEALRLPVLVEVQLPWVRDSRVAADVVARMLQDRSRPRYTARAARQQRRFVPGEVVTATVTSIGITGNALVTASTIAERGSTPTLELSVGAAPAIEIIASSAAYTPASYVGAAVTTQSNDRIIVITDEQSRPIAGAQCTLDGSLTRTTDGAGRVAFPIAMMPPGSHIIDVQAVGYPPMQLTVVV